MNTTNPKIEWPTMKSIRENNGKQPLECGVAWCKEYVKTPNTCATGTCPFVPTCKEHAHECSKCGQVYCYYHLQKTHDSQKFVYICDKCVANGS